jgi:[ribosomal protein S18]-alanine N-acetyltransferase
MIQAEPTIQLSIDRMQIADIDEVNRIERRSFSNPWPMSAYRRELRRPDHNSYFVLRAVPQANDSGHGEFRTTRGRFLENILPVRRSDPHTDEPHLVGYVGMWQMYDETHITTIAVDPVYRGFGYGEVLLVTAFAEAVARGSIWLSLEVRVSNDAAQALYRKYGLTIYGRRGAYYTDNREDALVMWSRSLRDREYQEQLVERRDALHHRLPSVDLPEFSFDQGAASGGVAGLPPIDRR